MHTPTPGAPNRRRLRCVTRTVVAAVSAGLAAVGTCAVAPPSPTGPGGSGPAAGQGVPAGATAPVLPGPQARRLCLAPATPGVMACQALVRTDLAPQHDLSPLATPRGFGPADLTSAYKLPAGGGEGRTIAVVDAYDDPNAESDLAAYRSQYGLPACTTANGCFRKADQRGGTDYPNPDPGWAGEISLDLDMVSAIAPKAHIVLVEAASSQMTDLGAAVNQAVALGAGYVSNSYGGSEDASDARTDANWFDHPGVAITVSSGDSGYGAQYPAASPRVIAVGGTSLRRDTSTRGWAESVWATSASEAAGSGCSSVEAKPSWQVDAGCERRTIADVSAVADPAKGVAVYDSYNAGGWLVYGGTSASAPIIAGVYALAGAPAASGDPAAYPYAHPGGLNDVTSGSNGSCGGGYLCTAGPGYDGPTGLGTPNGLTSFTG